MQDDTPHDDTTGDAMLPISAVATQLGVSVQTIRSWEAAGKISAQRTPGGQRRFRVSEVRRLQGHTPAAESVGRTTEAGGLTRG